MIKNKDFHGGDIKNIVVWMVWLVFTYQEMKWLNIIPDLSSFPVILLVFAIRQKATCLKDV